MLGYGIGEADSRITGMQEAIGERGESSLVGNLDYSDLIS